jgi:glutamate synthase domain-containing protein 3
VGSAELEPHSSSEVSLAVSELRDYHVINREVLGHLDRGRSLIRLAGVEGQRLLLHGLRGDWAATILVEGDAGPELASEMDARKLAVICTGRAADGAGRGLISGTLVVLGASGTALGYGQSGGSIAAWSAIGPRAGLDQAGGRLVLASAVGRLAGERQRGGTLVLLGAEVAGNLGHARRGGRLVSPAGRVSGTAAMGAQDVAAIGEIASRCAAWAPEFAVGLSVQSESPGTRDAGAVR